MNLGGKIILKKLLRRCFPALVTVFFILALTNHAAAQGVPDPAPATKIEAERNPEDTSSVFLTDDSLSAKKREDSLGIRISKDALPSVVLAEATDSAVLNMKENLFYLY